MSHFVWLRYEIVRSKFHRNILSNVNLIFSNRIISRLFEWCFSERKQTEKRLSLLKTQNFVTKRKNWCNWFDEIQFVIWKAITINDYGSWEKRACWGKKERNSSFSIWIPSNLSIECSIDSHNISSVCFLFRISMNLQREKNWQIPIQIEIMEVFAIRSIEMERQKEWSAPIVHIHSLKSVTLFILFFDRTVCPLCASSTEHRTDTHNSL